MSNYKKWIASALCATLLVGCGSKGGTSSDGSSHKVGGKIIYGSTTGLSGDLGNAWWTNNADDKAIRDLIDDYSVYVSDQQGKYVINKTVAESVDSVKNEDGTKTFTVKIKSGLKFSNGEEINAGNYVAYMLAAISPAAKEDKAVTSATAQQIVGGTDYMDGKTPYISGLRLIDENTYSITVPSDYVPYYYEDLYASLSPIYIPMYADGEGTVKDDGKGAYLDGAKFTKESLDASRYIYKDRVSAGPYKLVSLDTASYQATLTINENYAGNFEGQKPSIETVVMTKTVTETQMDALKTGQVDYLSGLTGGDEINAALDLEDAGGFTTNHYDRNGFGKLMFQCDFGPTQFEEVRHAVAYLLDRNAFVQQFCAGFGSVVDGPYGLASWLYQESKEQFESTLNHYNYSVDSAIEELKKGGWTFNADGSDYVDGSGAVRYKKVTAEEASVAEGKQYNGVVTLADGTLLMPLQIEWASSENNPVSEQLAVLLANADQTKNAGVSIKQNVMTFDELLNFMYRDSSQGEQYGVKTYGMYNLATNYNSKYDLSYTFTTDPDLLAQGYNTNFTKDQKLDDLSMDMVYGVESGDDETYLKKFQELVTEWNSYLPEIPLYSNVYYDVMNEKVKGMDNVNSLFDFSNAVVYGWVEE